MQRALVDQIGLFDPRYFLYFEEVDHCRAAKEAGWSVKFYPFTTVVHIGGESAKSQGPITSAGRQISELEVESKMLFYRKYYGRRGILTQLFLLLSKVVLSSIKDMLQPRIPSRRSEEVAELRLTLRILRATGWGLEPTR